MTNKQRRRHIVYASVFAAYFGAVLAILLDGGQSQSGLDLIQRCLLLAASFSAFSGAALTALAPWRDE